MSRDSIELLVKPIKYVTEINIYHGKKLEFSGFCGPFSDENQALERGIETAKDFIKSDYTSKTAKIRKAGLLTSLKRHVSAIFSRK